MTNQSSVVHSTFSIERTYPASLARVFSAFSDPATKRRWFAEGAILPDRRIVLAYTMAVGEVRISASLATVELVSAGDGTRLTYTEQGAFFEGSDGPKGREEGWRVLLEALGKELRRPQ